MRMLLRRSIAFIAGLLASASALPAFAQDVQSNFESFGKKAYGGGNAALTDVPLPTLIAAYISYFMMLLGIILVALIIYAGFLWMTAGGNEEQVTKAKKYILNAVIGLALIMSAYAITQFVVTAVT